MCVFFKGKYSILLYKAPLSTVVFREPAHAEIPAEKFERIIVYNTENEWLL